MNMLVIVRNFRVLVSMRGRGLVVNKRMDIYDENFQFFSVSL